MTATAPQPGTTTDWLRTLQDLDVGVIVQDGQAQIVYANPKAGALLGVTNETLAVRTTHDDRWDAVFQDGTPLAAEDHPGPRALATGEPVRDVVIGVKRGDAATRAWLLVSAVPHRAPDGAIQQVVISFTDVSAANRALRESDTTYASVFRSMSEGVVVHNADGTIKAANDAAERVLGMTMAQMQGLAATDPRWRLLAEDGTPLAPGEIPSEKSLRTGQPSGPTVLTVHRPDGDRAWLDVRADPLREPGEELVRGVVATFADITAARRTRLALEASRAQTQRVLDAVPGIVFQYRHRSVSDSKLVFVAGRIGELLGIDPAEVRADANVLFERLVPAQQAALQEAIARVIVTRGPFEHEICFEHVHGGVRWMRLYGVPDSGVDGVFYTGVMLDVTAERQMSDALRLRQRREAMGDMAAGIAHNFNNMLAVILPNMQMAREALQEPTADLQDLGALLADADRAARSAADLVRRMLALGRVDAHEPTEQVDLVPIIREALHICRQTFDRSIVIREQITVPAAMVRGSASEMQQVVLNLCLNARDALHGLRDPQLTVALHAEEANVVLLTVRDSGAGMSEQTLRRIGEPFFTTKHPGRGTGLGLASAFRTISEAGGTWSVMSLAGTGTTFSVQLPTTSPASSLRARATDPSEPPLTGTALVIDDEPMVREALARQITRTGMRVEVADGAEDGLRKIRSGTLPGLRVILLDLSMPGLSGVDALPHFKALVPDVPVIALSGYIPEDVPLNLATAVLHKPVGQQQLMTVLRELMEG
jgi:two-component system, cell cycle sensor histidine kinase and response regulator CckA